RLHRTHTASVQRPRRRRGHGSHTPWGRPVLRWRAPPSSSGDREVARGCRRGLSGSDRCCASFGCSWFSFARRAVPADKAWGLLQCILGLPTQVGALPTQSAVGMADLRCLHCWYHPFGGSLVRIHSSTSASAGGPPAGLLVATPG